MLLFPWVQRGHRAYLYTPITIPVWFLLRDVSRPPVPRLRSRVVVESNRIDWWPFPFFR